MVTMKSTTEIIKESEKAEGTVLDILIKNGCSKEDLEKASIMCTTMYVCGFEVGKRYVVK
jgi:hypothetical protein